MRLKKQAHLSLESRPLRVGFVPTMGALHAGHLSLIKAARRDNDCVVVSIFVNPLQFGPREDFHRYPRSLDQDRQHCESLGVEAIFAPTVEAMYGQGECTQVVPPPSMTQGLCGRSRPGHFTGVATVLLKLFQILQPDRAYFGQKDAQQLAIVRRMVTDLNVPVEIIACPIYRQDSGLALSSRNQYLSEAEGRDAPLIYQGLQRAADLFARGERKAAPFIQAVHEQLQKSPQIELDYVELVEPETLMPLSQIESRGLLTVAAKLGRTRLIDNMILDARKPILAIDGPAGAGKSTVTRLCAQRLGLLYLDTGAMYRAVTWQVLQSQIPPEDEVAVAQILPTLDLKLCTDSQAQLRVYIQGCDVTEVIRTAAVTAHVSTIAAQPAVRSALVKQQQRVGQGGGVAAEGRDIGTHVFPDAQLKIFLTATVEERARRRMQDLIKQGETQISLETLRQQIAERDRKDSSRAIAPLMQAPDAIPILTDGRSIDQVCDLIVQHYQAINDC
ncbi:bifunctional pantoate--beta-alanine ligase/(d)CMP kinase [Lyngbya confervoides BDU141951]|uniref:Bifunctional pantoate ligase/cytidylate kinase n=1 Tax=Lyngbya confervoides BDU141951 TaxID=1574623 RepID=A0ABD4T2L1_9CYAN|nr:bifunctional pantoate--beta-alanine ligase/(d)CMP kinase [Lyngbya confervoides BDU141951]